MSNVTTIVLTAMQHTRHRLLIEIPDPSHERDTL